MGEVRTNEERAHEPQVTLPGAQAETGSASSAPMLALAGSVSPRALQRRLVQRRRAGVVQRKGEGGPEGTAQGNLNEAVGAPVTGAVAISVPDVIPIAKILDPVTRNQAINQSYHAFDTAMNSYLGQPNVSNWCTFGQHASREAGTQIRNLGEGLSILDDAIAILTDFLSPSLATVGKIGPLVSALRKIVGLVQQPGMIAQLAKLAMHKAGIGVSDISDVISDIDSIGSWTSIIPGVGQYRVAKVLAKIAVLAGKLVIAIPEILKSAKKLEGNMIKGNKQIYENIAPAYSKFLKAANSSPDGNPGRMSFVGDASGFLAEAFFHYGNVHAKATDIAKATDGSVKGTLTAKRLAESNQANLLIGFQEQLVILQPIFDTMQDELGAVAGTMTLSDPNGTTALLPNGGSWGDFYTRMGIDPATAPADPTKIKPDDLPKLRSSSDPKFKGTIGQYFTDGGADANLHNAPPSISRF